jgi:hypothetical protein
VAERIFWKGWRGLTFGLAHQLREHGEFASIGKRHRDRVGSRLTNCKLPHIPLLLMGLSLRGVLQLVIPATVKTPSATAKI